MIEAPGGGIKPSHPLNDVLPYLATLPGVIAYNPEGRTLTFRRQPGFITLNADRVYITKVRDVDEGLELLAGMTRFAPRPLGVGFRRACGKGRGLAFGGPHRIGELGFQLLDAGFQVFNALFQPRIFS